MTGLANTEPYVGAQHPRAQGMQWFLSESTWQERQVQERRLQVLLEEPSTAPNRAGVLVIDEHGDRKRGHKTAHIGKQYLANLGKLDTGVVSVTSLWADEGVYYPVDFEPYTPADYFPKGKQDPAFRTKLKIGVELVSRAVHVPIPFRAVVADSFYGEDRSFRRGLRELKVGYVLALKPSHAWWHPETEIGSKHSAAQQAGWESAEHPGRWVKVTRTFRDGSSQDWWALELDIRPFGPEKPERVIVATTDPATLPDLTTFYLITNLPAPGSRRAQESQLAVASVVEVVRLYGLRIWVEQSYKQVKHALGWSEYQVRSDQAMRRHWQLVCCAFCFCWYSQLHAPATEPQTAPVQPSPSAKPELEESAGEQRSGGKKGTRSVRATARVLAQSFTSLKPPGSFPGSCSGDCGRRGRHCPHLSRSSSSLIICVEAFLCTSMPPIDLSQQRCGMQSTDLEEIKAALWEQAYHPCTRVRWEVAQVMAAKCSKGQLLVQLRGRGRWYPVESVTRDQAACAELSPAILPQSEA